MEVLINSKFITARFVPTDEVSVRTVFLDIASSELGGADGLLDCFVQCMNDVSVNTEKLVGVTTYGETANTGKKQRLWKLLKDHIGKDILTVWCVCHRSDLALESVQSNVPELALWMKNVLAVISFFTHLLEEQSYFIKRTKTASLSQSTLKFGLQNIPLMYLKLSFITWKQQ